MTASTLKIEMIEQAQAIARMHGDALDLIAEHAAEFRAIIKGFESTCGRPPTADEILWVASEHAGRDLTKEGR